MTFQGESKIEYIAKVVGIHAALLHNGKFLLFSYPSKHKDHSEDDAHAHDIFGSASHHGVYEIIDPESWMGETKNLERNIFCGGHCFLDNGDLFVSGGQYQAIHNPALLFDPPSICNYTFNMSEWKLQKRTLLARWYPSCVALPDGSALIVSGAVGLYGLKNIGPIKLVNRNLQLYDRKNGLKLLQKIPFSIGLYPFMHLLPNQRIFVHSEQITRVYNYHANKWETSPQTGKIMAIRTQYQYSRTNPVQGTSVILPFKQNEEKYARIMIIGGGGDSEDPKMDTPATNSCEILDFSQPELVWRYTTKMNFRRVMPDAIILPDGKILVLNGCERGKSDEGQDPVLIPELYNPINESWTKLSPMNVKRLYHSTALLLPDGRVITAGTDKEWNKGENIHDEYRIDVFSPPYLSEESRPEIKDVIEQVQYGENLTIECDNAEEILSVALLRPSSVTHSLNTDQRYIELEIINRNKVFLTAKIPSDPSIAPRGYYMLFILDNKQTPSKSRFVRVV